MKPALDAVCTCGHEYGDHSNLGRHYCIELIAPDECCGCDAFTAASKSKPGWDFEAMRKQAEANGCQLMTDEQSTDFACKFHGEGQVGALADCARALGLAEVPAGPEDLRRLVDEMIEKASAVEADECAKMAEDLAAELLEDANHDDPEEATANSASIATLEGFAAEIRRARGTGGSA